MIRIEEARNMNGLSQAQLAAKIGTSQQQIDRWEKPNIDVKSSVLVAISKACGVSVSWLLGLTDDTSESSIPSASGLTADEVYLIRVFRSCSPRYQSLLIETAASFRDSSQAVEEGSASFDLAVNE